MVVPGFIFIAPGCEFKPDHKGKSKSKSKGHSHHKKSRKHEEAGTWTPYNEKAESIQVKAERNHNDLIPTGAIIGGTLYGPPETGGPRIAFSDSPTIQIMGVLKSVKKVTHQQENWQLDSLITVFDLQFKDGFSIFNVANPFHFPIPVGKEIILEYRVAHFAPWGYMPCIHRLYVKPTPSIKEEPNDESDLSQQHDGPSSSDD